LIKKLAIVQDFSNKQKKLLEKQKKKSSQQIEIIEDGYEELLSQIKKEAKTKIIQMKHLLKSQTRESQQKLAEYKRISQSIPPQQKLQFEH